MTSITVVAAARPNFMKVAPIVKELRRRQAERGSSARCRLVHTGQHYDTNMSAVFFEELGIPAPDANLDVGSGSHAQQTAGVMLRFEEYCLSERPDWVVVVGDVNSTMACTLVAAKLGIRVAHVEAGLRSFDRSMPEEVNRVVTDALADALLTPSQDADANLLREGVPPQRIHFVGNVMIDSLIEQLPRARASTLPALLGLEPRGFAFVTLHRPANVDDRRQLGAVMEALTTLSLSLPVVFPVHPRTQRNLETFGLLEGARERPGLKLIEPVGYLDSLCLTDRARFVLTDSGGIQEESTYLRTPCLTLRPNTERPVTVNIGTNRLTGLERLASDIATVMAEDEVRGSIPPLWDGLAARRIADVLLQDRA